MYFIYLHYTHSQVCLKRLNGKVNFKPLQAALLVRVMSIMLLTDWGYDVAVFDPDAFVLQEPFEMYQNVAQKLSADIVGQRAVYPPDLAHSNGFTLCMGAVFYRGGSPHLSKLDNDLNDVNATWISCITINLLYTCMSTGTPLWICHTAKVYAYLT